MKHQIQLAANLGLEQGEPVACYRRWRAGPGSAQEALLLVDFELHQYWLADAPSLALTAVYCASQGHVQLAVTDRALVSDGSAPATQFLNWVAHHQLLAVTPGVPLELLPTFIAKPWGQEIWYSAVERRGVCRVGGGGVSVPLPWLQAVLPDTAAGPSTEPLLLLKILDPLARPVSGDLYFELHECKREAYLVTRIDPGAWPEGVGYIRYGFAADKRAACADDQDFRARYLQAVRAYEAVRRQLDALPGTQEPDEQLLVDERRLREEMDSYTALRPLRVGDVLVIPPWLPHALQHGVRTIEFQTPVYERRILSFAQKVETQDYWDTASVAGQMLLEPPPAPPFTCLLQERGLRVERIVDFAEFEVLRITLGAGARHEPDRLPHYGLVIVIEGELALSGATYVAEQAVLLSRGRGDVLASADPAQPVVLLLALPRR